MRGRAIVLMMAAGALLAAGAALPAQAQYYEETKPLTLFIDLGYVNLSDYPRWIALGPELEVRLGRSITVNPELSAWLRTTLGSTVNIVPGATVNFRLRRFFAGAGAVRRVSDWNEAAGGWLVPKFQIGFLTGPAKLALSLLYLNRADTVVLGLGLGIGVGRQPGY
jgi:hypothetical protein